MVAQVVDLPLTKSRQNEENQLFEQAERLMPKWSSQEAISGLRRLMAEIGWQALEPQRVAEMCGISTDDLVGLMPIKNKLYSSSLDGFLRGRIALCPKDTAFEVIEAGCLTSYREGVYIQQRQTRSLWASSPTVHWVEWSKLFKMPMWELAQVEIAEGGRAQATFKPVIGWDYPNGAMGSYELREMFGDKLESLDYAHLLGVETKVVEFKPQGRFPTLLGNN